MTSPRLPAPAALLLDFGGVVVETTRRTTWPRELAVEVHALLNGRGWLGVDDIEVDIQAARVAYRGWKNAMSRVYAPRETTCQEFWADFVAADWPPVAHSLVAAHARPLCRRMVELQAERKPRNGIDELLRVADAEGVAVGIVSNAMVGQVHRDVVHELGLDDLIGAQIYSDEVGIRKPNPDMIHLAARALAAPTERVWYVGDNVDRDVVCGRRAGVAATILMIAKGTYDPPFAVRHQPDAVVGDPAVLLTLFLTALTSA